ncbi:glycosyl transferase family 2 [Nannochloropsis oceanica]
MLDHGNPPPPPPTQPVWWGEGNSNNNNDAVPNDNTFNPPTRASQSRGLSSGLAPRVYLFTKYPVPGRAKTRIIPALGKEGAARLHRQLVRQALQTLDTFRKGSSSRSSSSSSISERKVVDCRIRYDDALAGEDGESKMKAWLGLDWIYEPQGPGDLGVRMAAATGLADGGEQGVGPVVLIGSDCPFIKPKHLKEALAALEDEKDEVEGEGEEGGGGGGNDLVLGPAKDGGYWLIGLRRPCAALFQGVDWGTERVLKQTLAIAAELGMKVKLLEVLHDMDRPEDLKLWSPPPLTSIIIPTLNEASNLAATLAAVYNGTSRHHAAALALLATASAAGTAVEGRKGGLKMRKKGMSNSTSSSIASSSTLMASNASSSSSSSSSSSFSSSSSPPPNPLPPSLPTTPTPKHVRKNGLKIHDPNLEVIVVDGGSTDGTQRLALALGARLVQSPLANRAAQLNLGAAEAAGDILLFLHGDTLLPPTWEDDVRGAFAGDPTILATAFKLKIMGRRPFYRVIEASITARSSWPWSMPYGDQALAVRRKVFDVLGGFPDVPIMEDYSFVQALRVLAKRPPPPKPRSRRKGGKKGGREGRGDGGMYGGRIELLPSCVRTSGRRWERVGVLRTTLINQCVILGWHLKVEPDRLAVFYRQAKHGGGREGGRWWERKGEPMTFVRARGVKEGEEEEEEEEEEEGEEEERRRMEEKAFAAVLPLVGGF